VKKLNLLTIENISKRYSEKELFNNITFGINEEDKIGLIGINGTGKSTLLKIITENVVPDSGRIIKRNDLKIEYLSQNPHFKQNATILEQVFYGNNEIMKTIREYNEAIEDKNTKNERIIKLSAKMDMQNAWDLEAEAKEMLTKLGISDFTRKVDNLSGGQRKRIALASALIKPCDLLILDEPTNHLDIKYQLQLMNIVKKLKITVLSAIHDLNIAALYCDKIYALKDGKVVAYGTPKEVLTKRTIKYIYDVDCEIIEREDNGAINIIYNASF